MKILAFDTATEACSVALWQEHAVHERFELGVQHSERILSMVDEVLSDAGFALGQLDAIAFGRGPGSFTGLRIAAGVAQGLAFGADLPVVPVSSLAALAQGQANVRVIAAFDARMQQVYYGTYERNAGGLMDLVGEEIVSAPDAVPVPDGHDWVGAGSGWDQYTEVLRQRLGDRLIEWRARQYPHARFVAVLGAAGYSRGAAVRPEDAVPVYIRDDVAAKKKPAR